MFAKVLFIRQASSMSRASAQYAGAKTHLLGSFSLAVIRTSYELLCKSNCPVMMGLMIL